MQRDARPVGRGGVGRTAVCACGHGGGVEVGGGVSPRCGVCAVLGDHLLEDKEGGGWRMEECQEGSSDHDVTSTNTVAINTGHSSMTLFRSLH